MKKKAALLIVLCIITAYLPAFAFYDVDKSTAYGEAVERLAAYGIISGNPDGTFAPDAPVTRAELAVIAVKIADCTVSFGEGGLFADLAAGYWGTPYINEAAKNGLIFGYPDGRFYPERNVSYAEYITVVMRLLGYTTAQLGNNYPYAYLNKASELKLTDGLSFDPNAAIDRKTVCVIADRAMLLDVSDSGGRKTKLLSNLDLSLSDECVILATSAENASLMEDEAATTIGNFKYSADIGKYVTGTVKLVTDSDNKIIAAVPVPKEHKRIVAEAAAGSEVTYMENGTLNTVSFLQNNTFYYNLQKSTFSDVKGQLEKGDVLDIYYVNSRFEYAVVTSYELDGPYIVMSEGDKYMFGSDVKAVRDGYNSSADKLELYDVIYFDRNLNTVYAYCDKKSGIYEKALPDKADVKQIVLSGNTYDVGTQAAKNALSDSGSGAAINDYITLLLGRDGDIAGVVFESTDISQTCGILISCDERVVDKTKKYYGTFMTANGQLQEFQTDRSYENYRGKIFRYKFADGILTPSVKTYNGALTGAVDLVQKRIGQYSLAANAVVIDRLYAPKNGEDLDAEARVIELSDISKTTVNTGDVLDFGLDKNGQIAYVIFDNITMEGYKFALVTNVDKMSDSSVYKLDIGGEAFTYNVNFVSSVKKNTPVMAQIQDNRLLNLVPLTLIGTKGKVTELADNRIIVGDESYPLYKSACIYVSDDNYKYNATAIEDIDIENISSVSIYADKQPANGGLIRIILIGMKK